jgi:two-component system invasion response regulator UvrY
MKPVRILIADDHVLIAEMWSALLSSKEKYEVIDKVNSCGQLMEAVQRLHPDIVLLDIILSDGSSLDILAELKKVSPDTRFLAVSAHTDLATVKRSFTAGVDGYFTKTSTLEELDEAIHAILEGHSYQCKEVRNLIMDAEADIQDNKPGDVNKALLTRKEKQVAYLVYEGLSAKDIAQKLGVSFKTVEVHRHHIYQKLGIQKASRLIWYVKENLHLFSDVNV